MVDLTKLNPNSKRGYVAAREFLFSQFFLWVGAVVGVLHYGLSNSWERSFEESALISLAVSFVYLPFLYVRALIKAWRVWRGHDQPEEITAEQEKSKVEAAKALLKQIGGGGS